MSSWKLPQQCGIQSKENSEILENCNLLIVEADWKIDVDSAILHMYICMYMCRKCMCKLSTYSKTRKWNVYVRTLYIKIKTRFVLQRSSRYDERPTMCVVLTLLKGMVTSFRKQARIHLLQVFLYVIGNFNFFQKINIISDYWLCYGKP